MLNFSRRDAKIKTQATTSTLESLTSAQVTAELRRLLPDLYFINTSSAQMARHLDLIHRVQREDLLIDFSRPPGSHLTELTLCAYDDVEPGLLAKLCGTLAARHIEVQTAFIFTIDKARCEAGYARSDIILDTFFVSETYRGERQRALPDASVADLRAELTKVLHNEVSVEQLLERAYGDARPPMIVHEVAAMNTDAGHGSMIVLHAQNAPGVLYRTAASLAAMKLNIRIAQVNTEGPITNDVFFVTKSDGQVPDAVELSALAARLRQTMMQSDIPFRAQACT